MSPETTSSPAPELVPWVEMERLVALPAARVIDLRSPGEFETDHLPGADNLPLFDDGERALVGFLYKQHSPDRAFDEGRKIVLKKIGTLVEQLVALAGWPAPRLGLEECVAQMTAGGIEQMEREFAGTPAGELPEHPVVLHCLRGGLRSRSVVALLRRLGYVQAFALSGGYRSYRLSVREQLDTWRAPESFTLRGWTGVGKTLVLRELEHIRPGWTIDLEGLAGHRSSLLGMVGLEPCSQKTFESRLAARLRAGFAGPVVFEGESRRVGNVEIPPRVWESLQAARNIELVAPTARRVEVLMEDYLALESARPELRAQLAAVEQRMQREGQLVQLFDARREAELVEILLEAYYDPLYRHSEQGHSYELRVDASDPRQAARQIAAWIEA